MARARGQYIPESVRCKGPCLQTWGRGGGECYRGEGGKAHACAWTVLFLARAMQT
jgi:hypothetical protein